MTKVHRVVLLIVDHDDVGRGGVISVIENASFPNDCMLEQDLETARAELKRLRDAINAARDWMPGMPDTQALVRFWKAIKAIDTKEPDANG